MKDFLSKRQILSINKILKIASEESSFYKKKFKNFKKSNLKIKNYEDFKKIPLTTADELKDKNTQFVTNLRKSWRIWCTTGTTGQPKLSFASFDLIKGYKEEFEFMLNRAGVSFNEKDIAAVFFPMTGLAGSGPAVTRAFEELKVPVLALGIEAEPNLAYEIMKKAPPTFIFMYPSSFLLFTNKLKEIDSNFSKKFKVKAMVSTGEPLTDNMRNYFESEWKTQCFDMTGSVDVSNWTGGDCKEHNGFHLFTDKFFFEVYDHNTRKISLEGEGELVLTTLTNNAMPLVRYFSRDQVRISKGKCKCGLNTPKMWHTQRLDDRVILAGAIKFYVTEHINEILKEFPDITSIYRVIISNKNNKDLIELIVEADKKFVGNKKLEKEISKSIIELSPDFLEGIYQDKIIAIPKVKIVEIGTLERLRGKVKDKLIDKRKINYEKI